MESFADRALHVAGLCSATLGALLRVFAKVGAVLTLGWWIYELAVTGGLSFTTIIPVALLMACGVSFLVGSAIKNVGVSLMGDCRPDRERS
ncbi:TPA: hypothetical protein ACOEBF_001313 [Stenotrophomonas maltophilia]|uniref:hypothetical protein n=1 Tax=Gammaproteobacteria TaxID=1236 RepID=UPI000E3274C5|nr:MULTISPECIES: hypothetical protein [Gammaproteobacteria]MCU1124941.1 hypothetical protein [Stenotrophomonas maltophilia]MCU1142278.1 hypothetical protein [Stenotrophomonas maltophilia]HEL3836366.1 hypothetical protein [Stenotrophomonas maltophilia]HEL3845499.1 hypothetical protein [Stenotrophomonas maltophilia]HEL4292530.1 hypothetical protein [Stenotrophomonas maltophilia]